MLQKVYQNILSISNIVGVVSRKCIGGGYNGVILHGDG